MRSWARTTGWLLAWQAASGLCLPACEGAGSVAKLQDRIVTAGAGTAARTRTSNVIPSKPAVAEHEIVVEDERYLGDLARQLGVTVDSVVADNNLPDHNLQRGMRLKVHTGRDLVDAYVAKREHRKQVKAAAEAARIAAKLKADAEARAAKRAARRAARLAQHGHGATAREAAGKKPAKPAAAKGKPSHAAADGKGKPAHAIGHH